MRNPVKADMNIISKQTVSMSGKNGRRACVNLLYTSDPLFAEGEDSSMRYRVYNKENKSRVVNGTEYQKLKNEEEKVWFDSPWEAGYVKPAKNPEKKKGKK